MTDPETAAESDEETIQDMIVLRQHRLAELKGDRHHRFPAWAEREKRSGDVPTD